jgi:predicted neuraminidase
MCAEAAQRERVRIKRTWQIGRPQDADVALIPATVNTRPGSAYEFRNRNWQGIPGLERTPQGRLWVTWYSGGTGEGADNYVLLITSDDDAQSWSEPRLVIDLPGRVRAYDPCLWLDPLGRLWLFWAQSYEFFDGRAGVWAIRCDDPDAAEPRWSEPKRIANGVMMNKPTVSSNGAWLAPTAVWDFVEVQRPELDGERFSNVSRSLDQGETWEVIGGADVPHRQFDEHMIVERRDGSLWMLVRTADGIGESFSTDGGYTWTPGRDSGLGGPASRFFIRRLQSGRLLLVNHHNFTKRNNLTAMLSDDDGATWYGHLLLDERDKVAYPDGVETEDGQIYIVYDHDRYGDKEIMLAVFTEEDVAQGKISVPGSRLKQRISGSSQE